MKVVLTTAIEIGPEAGGGWSVETMDEPALVPHHEDVIVMSLKDYQRVSALISLAKGAIGSQPHSVVIDLMIPIMRDLGVLPAETVPTGLGHTREISPLTDERYVSGDFMHERCKVCRSTGAFHHAVSNGRISAHDFPHKEGCPVPLYIPGHEPVKEVKNADK